MTTIGARPYSPAKPLRTVKFGANKPEEGKKSGANGQGFEDPAVSQSRKYVEQLKLDNVANGNSRAALLRDLPEDVSGAFLNTGLGAGIFNAASSASTVGNIVAMGFMLLGSYFAARATKNIVKYISGNDLNKSQDNK